MTVTLFDDLDTARDFAAHHLLREKAMCLVVRQRPSGGAALLVLDHPEVPEAGVQLPAGGVEAGETPEAAAGRELGEETGLSLPPAAHLKSYLWEAQLPDRRTRQVCHAFLFLAPPDLPDEWERQADGERFAFRWLPAATASLDWEMDAALPDLLHHLQSSPMEPSHD